MFSVQLPKRINEDQSPIPDQISDALLNASPPPLLSVGEYRKLQGDQTSTDQQIMKRITYLEAFCRNIIKNEIQNNTKK